MESWNYGSEGKGFMLSDEMVSPTDTLAGSRTVLMGWELKTPCNCENPGLFSRKEADESQGFMELGLPDITRKSLPDNLYGEFWDSKMVGTGRVSAPIGTSTPKEMFGEPSCSRISSSAVDSSSQDSSLFDLKLGRLADYRDVQNAKSPIEMPVLSPVASSVPEKRTRTSLAFQTPVCQVLGCNMDLSNSKDYHKRHKVCEVHSKTPKVIVNGIEQRFCQQCSRFHLLAEFDDGKRSCRKRLAGHNQRRRKPLLDNHSSRTGKLFASCTGSRFLGTSLPTRTSFICPDIFPSSIVHPLKCETSNWCKRVKLEDEAVYSPTVMPTMNEHLIPKSYLPPHGTVKQFPSLNGNGIEYLPGSIFYDNKQRYPQSLTGSNSISQFALRSVTSGSEDGTVFSTASSIHGLSGASDSNSALSLLSSQSQNSNHSSGVLMARPVIIQGNHAQCNLGHYSEKFLGVSSQASLSLASNRFSSAGVNSVEMDHLEPPIMVCDTPGFNFELQADRIYQGSEFMSAKNHLSDEHATTVNLLQLSSQLQHAEHQRNSMQLKQANDAFCCLPDTSNV